MHLPQQPGKSAGLWLYWSDAHLAMTVMDPSPNLQASIVIWPGPALSPLEFQAIM